jgi:toxin ParE1/3/4
VRIDYENRALIQLESIRDWYTDKAGPEEAANIVRALFDRCESLAEFPHRGTPHDDIRPGLRTILHERRFTIGYRVDGAVVTVLGVIGRGQLIEALVVD